MIVKTDGSFASLYKLSRLYDIRAAKYGEVETWYRTFFCSANGHPILESIQ